MRTKKALHLLNYAWKDKIFTAQNECENVPDTQDLKTDTSTARTRFLAFITAAF